MSNYHEAPPLRTSNAPRSRTMGESGALTPSPRFVPVSRRRLVSSPGVSRGELLLFRLIERLSKGAAGCVHNFAKLAEMLKRCERQAWTLWGRLVRAGFVAYRIYRKGGKQYFEFWPLVRISEAPEPSFFRRKTALRSAPSKPENCTLEGGTPYKTSVNSKAGRQQTEHTSAQPCSVAVSLLKEVCSQSEALELAREAEAQKLSPEQIQRVLAAYRSQAANIRNRGAWLREALRRGFSPPAPASEHDSDQSRRPVHCPVRVSATWFEREPKPAQDPCHALTAPRIAQPETLQGEQGKSSAWEALRGKMGMKGSATA